MEWSWWFSCFTNSKCLPSKGSIPLSTLVIISCGNKRAIKPGLKKLIDGWREKHTCKHTLLKGVPTESLTAFCCQRLTFLSKKQKWRQYLTCDFILEQSPVIYLTLVSRWLMLSSLHTSPASALGDSMDQLSQRSSSERTQFMSREDLDQEGSLDLDHEQYHYHDQDQDQYTDQELEQHDLQDQDQGQRQTQGANMSTPTKTLELKVQDERIGHCSETQICHRTKSKHLLPVWMNYDHWATAS